MLSHTGPSKLPELGKGLGKTVKSFQTAAKVRGGGRGGGRQQRRVRWAADRGVGTSKWHRAARTLAVLPALLQQVLRQANLLLWHAAVLLPVPRSVELRTESLLLCTTHPYRLQEFETELKAAAADDSEQPKQPAAGEKKDEAQAPKQ